MLTNKRVKIRTIFKVVLIVFMFFGVQINKTHAQKESKKEKDKKSSGKITKENKTSDVIKYRRSSLHTMIIEDTKLPKADLILKTFNEAPFPEKYNNHTIGEKSFDLAKYFIEPEEGDEKSKNDYSRSINNYFQENKIANKIIAKWFNRADDGTFNMDLISSRGMYDASSKDISVANSTERGVAMLADAGEDLIGNTFVVVNYSKFVENEPIAKAIQESSYAAVATSGDMAKTLAEKAADVLYDKTKDGYSVWTTAYLYQLGWTDSTSAIFYQNLWNDPSAPNAVKKEAFDNSDLFELKLLGFQKAPSFISGMGENAENNDMIIENATKKSISAVYNKLQKKFEAFRTKTPLVSASPLGAKIGMKEGLSGGDRYEVLEKQLDKDGNVKWKRKGVIKVDKKKIWDNRVAAGEILLDENGEQIKPENDLEYTHFKGDKGFYPGMLLRQIN